MHSLSRLSGYALRPLVPALLSMVGLVILIVSTPVLAKAEALTKEQGNAILEELKGIRRLLETMQVPARGRGGRPGGQPAKVTVSLVDSHALGRPDAPLTMIEFTDYQCPYCRRFTQQTFPALKRAFIDTGKLRFVSRDLPLKMHQHAFQAAQAARCAGEQDHYWTFREVVFANDKRLGRDALLGYAQDMNIDMDAFRGCLDSDRYRKEIERDIADAQAIGATGTPTFVLGKTSAERIEGLRLVGALPFASFERQIKSLLPSSE